MKHKILTVLFLALMGGTTTLRASFDFEADGLYYSIADLNAGTVVVTSGENKYEGDITIPESVSNGDKTYAVTGIGDNAFRMCSDLTSVTFPSSLKTIGSNAFSLCSKLTTVAIPEGVTSISDYSFSACSGLISVTIPEGVTSFGREAFSHCSFLTSIAIPEGVKSLGAAAFSGCSSLESITIPASVTSIGEQAFMGCMGLNMIKVNEGNKTFDSRNDCNAIIETATNTLIVGCHATVIPESVTYIGDNAFLGCGSLTSFTIPEGVKSIGDNAFMNCGLLATLYLPKSLTTIGSHAFFFCYGLAEVYCYAANVPATSADAFEYSNIDKATLHVYDYTYDAYSTTEPWSTFGEIVKEREILPCATPTISFVDGKLVFKSETEGATFTYDIKDDDIKSGTGSEVALTATYQISVYASAEYCYDSKVATATLCWIAVAPQTEGLTDEDAVTEVKALPVLIQNDGKAISVQGVANGTEVSVFSSDGRKHDAMVSVGGSVTLHTSLQPGSIAIVKIGERAVKVMMK